MENVFETRVRTTTDPKALIDELDVMQRIVEENHADREMPARIELVRKRIEELTH